VIDLIYLAKGRREFTRASLDALMANTNWRLARLIVYTDGDDFPELANAQVRKTVLGGPVAIMNAYLAGLGTPVFAKIDNDVIVPAGWLEHCLTVMEANPDLGLLGIEPPRSRTPAPWKNGVREADPELQERRSGTCPTYAACGMIGGIGLMRRSAFRTADPMTPHSIYGGFSDWQLRHTEVVKGWICPPLDLFLLDRLPIEPWASFSKEYIGTGQQRPWTNYDPMDSALWDWWMETREPGLHA
jgi:hypothetical protein